MLAIALPFIISQDTGALRCARPSQRSRRFIVLSRKTEFSIGRFWRKADIDIP
jgi:hypothetical protein